MRACLIKNNTLLGNKFIRSFAKVTENENFEQV